MFTPRSGKVRCGHDPLQTYRPGGFQPPVHPLFTAGRPRCRGAAGYDLNIGGTEMFYNGPFELNNHGVTENP